MTDPSRSTIEEAHAAWDKMNRKVREHERLLAEALQMFSEGRGPLPQDMLDEVQVMRGECNARFKALMSALGQKKKRPEPLSGKP
jgi:hypothetical protein